MNIFFRLSTFLRLTLVVIVICGLYYDSANAGDKNRQKVIDFEDQLVEGMNKQPLDSLNQISEKDRKKKKPHLYRKRTGFRSETNETLGVMRYNQ